MLYNINLNNWDMSEDPKTIEEYLNLNCMKKAALKLRWIQEGKLEDKLRLYEVKPTKRTYQLTNIKDNNVIIESEYLEDILALNIISKDELYYLKWAWGRYKDKKEILYPKFAVYNSYRLKENNYIIKGNDYIKIEEAHKYGNK